MVTPVLTVAERLIARGHRVRVMSDACNAPEVITAGATFVPWSRAPGKAGRSREFDTFNDWDAPTPAEGFDNLMRALLIGPALDFARDLMDELAREPADLVIVTDLLFGAALGCEAAGQRFALLAVNIPLFPLPGFVPFGPGFTPARTLEEAELHVAAARQAHVDLDRWLPALNHARAELGLAPLTRLMHQHAPAQKLLLATSRAFDFAPAELPEHVEYVGPQLGEPKWVQAWRWPFPAGDDRPLVMVSFSSTFQDHVAPLQRIIDALAWLPVKAIVTLGGAIAIDELRAAPNVLLVESAPHGELMRRAAVVVSHGGHGTVMKALAAAKPMLLVPHGRDQEDNAARVSWRGAGLTVPRTSSTETFHAALTRLLTEPAFGACAAALGARVAEEAARSPVATVLERLAGLGPAQAADPLADGVADGNELAAEAV